MTKVSIIIPVYNAEKTLSKCLDAILNQTYGDFEVICVDDGSKDSSYEILKRYADNDERIKAYTQENHGPAFTRNFAISNACGDYLMFCDADDWYEPDMVKSMVETIEEQNTDIVMCDCNIYGFAEDTSQNSAIRKYHSLKIKGYCDFRIDYLSKLNGVLWNKIYRMDIIKTNNIQYPSKYEHDDTMFFLKYF